jgi:hypothetical protein
MGKITDLVEAAWKARELLREAIGNKIDAVSSHSADEKIHLTREIYEADGFESLMEKFDLWADSNEYCGRIHFKFNPEMRRAVKKVRTELAVWLAD